MIDTRQIEVALEGVFDPCSVQANAPLNVLNMGLITGIDIRDGGMVGIKLRPTSPWCTMIGSIMAGVEETLRALEGVTDVTVEIDRSSTWSEDDLTQEGRLILTGARDRSRAAYPVRRQQWKERAASNGKDQP